jgi:hypothetical protein
MIHCKELGNLQLILLLLFVAILLSSCSKKTTVTISPQKTPSQLAFERDVFQTYVSEEITPLKGDFRTTVYKFNDANAKFGSSEDTLILLKLKELKESTNNSLPFNFTEASQFTYFVSDTVNDTTIIANYYLQLTNLANYEGKLAESLHYDSILLKSYPTFRSDAHIARMDKVAETYNKLQLLEKQRLKDDELLWQTGLLYKDLFLITGPFINGSPALFFPLSFFRKLLRHYPDSPYADDADYQIMISHDKPEDLITREDQLRWIANYQKFLNAYPGTNCTPYIYQRLAELYLIYSQNEDLQYSVQLSSYEQSKSYLDMLLKNFPKFANDSSIIRLTDEYTEAWNLFTWSFQIRADKREYHPGEPVMITYDLKNTDKQAKILSLFANIDVPNFITIVEYFPIGTDENRYLGKQPVIRQDGIAPKGASTDIFKINRTQVEYLKTDTLVSANKRYIEKWDIQQNALLSFNQSAGSYSMKEEGKYRITAFAFDDIGSNKSKQSNSIWITVRKNL